MMESIRSFLGCESAQIVAAFFRDGGGFGPHQTIATT
jgi:hypothetical protein